MKRIRESFGRLAVTSTCALLVSAILTQGAWASGYCYQTPPDVKVRLPVREGAPLPEEVGTVLGIGYSVSDSGIVHIYIEHTTTETFLGVRTTRAPEDSLPERSERHLGRVITHVERGTAAAAADLRVGDIIVTFNGENVADYKRFGVLIHSQDPEKAVQLEFYRGEEKLRASVKLGAREVTAEADRALTVQVLEDFAHSGLVLGAMTRDLAPYFPETCRDGAIVLSMQRGSPAFDSPIRVGDVITGTADGKVDRPRRIIEAIARAADEDKEITLAVQRGDQTFEAKVRPVANLRKTSEYRIPFVLDWDKSHEQTDIALGPWGTLLGFQKEACFDEAGDPDREWRFGMLLNLIELERKHDTMHFNLLWIIRFRW